MPHGGGPSWARSSRCWPRCPHWSGRGRRRTTTGPPPNCARPRSPASTSSSPGTPNPPAGSRCPSPTSSARWPTCSATGPRCGSGGAAPTDNRVDVVSAGGETGVYRDARGTWTWEYEANRATRTADAPLALPAPPDLLPNTLGRPVARRGRTGELSRIGARPDRRARRPGPAPGAGGRRLVGGPGRDLRGRRDRAAAAGAGLRQGRRQPRARHPFRRPRPQPAERRR